MYSTVIKSETIEKDQERSLESSNGKTNYGVRIGVDRGDRGGHARSATSSSDGVLVEKGREGDNRARSGKAATVEKSVYTGERGVACV